ncbi:MAG: hypothetical protein DLM53_09080 [Candidatus Eremiobacter antarcticus]|nr:hypothetical protein [Candidatus Eremiobacteraeota bacterium]MBC5807576.1 hypothetical protein [Candidatus Eremiobacteraeota bacterium]PZR61373.1 MAG: hypothetical protein DLM53_09080 [Candidatus Eremiobacter sp. RRmetagenome_bin22]
MGVKKAFNRTVKDVKDSVSEGKHRAKAGAERGKRETAGSQMTASQKVSSNVKEAGHKTAAGVDKTKRKVRDKV